jgi:hypothetical protein
MRPTTVVLLGLAMAAVPKAAGAAAPETAPALQLKPKAAIVTAAPHQSAPFVMPTPFEPELALTPPRHARTEKSAYSCENATTLCYDPPDRRIVYKPARNFMPDLPGLRRENISVKRDRIILRYSF